MTLWAARSLTVWIVVLIIALPCRAADTQHPEHYGNWLAKMAAFHGSVETQRANRPRSWESAVIEESYFNGDRIRTGPRSRAQLQLRRESYLALDQNTVAAIGERPSEVPMWLQVILGKLHIRNRQPRTLDITTPYVNAVHRGTEFQVEVRDQATVITVFDGEVEANNAHGTLNITKGQSAIARQGEAPRLYTVVKPEDAVQWALYYPPVIDFSTASASDAPDFVRALSLYRRNDIPGALALLDTVPAADRTSRFINLRAGLLLTVGRLDETEPDIAEALRRNPKDATALAQQAVIAVARNRKDDALRLAEGAVAADGRSSSAKLALSYALQARFELNAARDVIRTAHRDDPKNALVLTRLAELELSLGEMDEGEEAATEALRLNPKQGRAKSLLGFAKLLQMDTDEAIATFNQAVVDDPSDPLGRFGFALAKIRKGDLEEGTVELETAASLNPDAPLIRSYLGKAYYEQKRSEPAATEYQIAKDLDPKDPTPYFYDAIKKQTENRPVEAIWGLQKAESLNGNRAIYRSSEHLDQDYAARGAVVGRIYNQLGFGQRGLVEGWRALANDPSDHTSHRLLADIYATLPRQDLAQTSELLQSLLLQPINITPLQPRLAESQLFLLNGLGPSALSLNEFNQVFQRTGFNTLASGQIGSNDTYSDEIVHSGLWRNLSYSLGQFHYQTAGYRKNNDIDANLYNAFAQAQLTSSLNIQAEYRHREIERGNLESYFSPLPSQEKAINTLRRKSESDTYRFGVHFTPTSRSDLIGSVIYSDQSYIADANLASANPIFNRLLVGEALYQHRFNSVNSTSGVGHYDLTTEGRTIQHSYGFSYLDAIFFQKLAVQLGLNFSSLDDPNFPKKINSINPKFGLLWNISEDTLIRAAIFRTSKSARLPYQTLERVQIGGFTQFFDDLYRSKAVRWGLGLDQKLGSTIWGGIEMSRRSLQVRSAFSNDDGDIIGETEKRQRELLYRAYLLWTPNPDWSATAEYLYESFHDSGPRDTKTQSAPVTISYFNSNGLFATGRATYFEQTVGYREGPRADHAVFLDFGIGYRLPNRLGLFEVQLQNLLDQSYRYQGLQQRQPTDNSGIPQFLPFPPDFTISSRVTLAF